MLNAGYLAAPCLLTLSLCLIHTSVADILRHMQSANLRPAHAATRALLTMITRVAQSEPGLHLVCLHEVMKSWDTRYMIDDAMIGGVPNPGSVDTAAVAAVARFRPESVLIAARRPRLG